MSASRSCSAPRELIRSRKERSSDLITLELGISKKDSLYECGRAYDVFSLAGQLAILDDGQIFSCDLTPHGKSRARSSPSASPSA